MIITRRRLSADFVGGKKETAGWKLKKRKKSGRQRMLYSFLRPVSYFETFFL